MRWMRCFDCCGGKEKATRRNVTLLRKHSANTPSKGRGESSPPIPVPFIMLVLPLLFVTLSLAFHPTIRPKVKCISRLGSLFGDSVDLSNGKSLLLKKVLKQGNWNAPLPEPNDFIDLKWELRFLNGTSIGSSQVYEETNGELFRFRLGAQPREVIEAWETTVRSMRLGEVCSVYIAAELAFGEKGLGELVPPHSDIETILELVKIVPPLSKRFKSVGANESISEELIAKMECVLNMLRCNVFFLYIVSSFFRSGDSPLAEEFARSEAERKGDRGNNSDAIPRGPSVESEGQSGGGSSVKEGEGRKKEGKEEEQVSEGEARRRFFDERVHKLDPNRRVSGKGNGFEWEETPSDLDVTLLLPESASKEEVSVEIAVSRISIAHAGRVLLEGPLFGRVIPSECQWALLESEQSGLTRVRKLVISLRKGYQYSDIWASVLDRSALPKAEEEF